MPARSAMSGTGARHSNQQVVPRPVRPLDERVVSFPGERGAADEPDARAAQGLRPGRVRGRDLRALAGRGRLRARTAPARAPTAPSRPSSSSSRRPNVTGSLHLGHAQRTAVEDLMIRHARMQGRPALFLPGLDHASIAAQFVLDGILAKEGESRASLGRERYLERMRAFIDDDPRGHARPAAPGRGLGATGAGSGSRWTMSRRNAVRARVRAPLPRRPRLPHRGARQLVPGCRTSLSATSRSSPTPTTGYALDGPLPPGRRGDRRCPTRVGSSRVATTRPETILGDTGVAVHPDDARYAALVGRPRPDPVR